MSLHHERQRAQHGHPLHRDHTEDLETGIASAVREIDEMRAENERLLDMLNRANAAEAQALARLNLAQMVATQWGPTYGWVPYPALRAALEGDQP